MCFLGGFSIEFGLKLLAPLYGGVLFVAMFLGCVMNPREPSVWHCHQQNDLRSISFEGWLRYSVDKLVKK